MPPSAQKEAGARVANGVQGSTADSHHRPRKPWEQVHFDPALKPKDYQIKGILKTWYEKGCIGY